MSLQLKNTHEADAAVVIGLGWRDACNAVITWSGVKKMLHLSMWCAVHWCLVK